MFREVVSACYFMGRNHLFVNVRDLVSIAQQLWPSLWRINANSYGIAVRQTRGVTFFENGTWITTLDTSHEAIVIPIPEPSTLTILCAGAVVPLALMRRRPRACRGPLAT